MLDVIKLRSEIKRSQYRTFKAFAQALGITEQGLRKIFTEGRTKEDTFFLICELLNTDPVNIASDEYLEILLKKKQAETRTGIGKRIRELIDRKNFKDIEFAASIGVSKSTLATVLKRDNCQLEIVQRILENHRDVSAEWIVTGSSDMLKLTPMHHVTEPELQYKTKIRLLEEELANCRETVKNLNRLLREKR
ncbi:MAG: hypothetical protein CVU11_13970 [Bacteroidetes bacterium HGW-Bacteroidetes-6]|jgi:transcriptional regulator with XRE-family HTH domain|nr:MAG: hypothetical protein CVU11_13970 [Bacteroidetes bacterium HGW-Bacteroidetes-6]